MFRKSLLPVLQSQRQNISTTCSLQKASGQMSKQVHMLKKIMAGREKGNRRWKFNENLPKLENVQKISTAKGQGKESNRRITVLNKLFMKNITDLMATDSFSKSIVGFGIQVTAVKVAPDFNSLNVFWLATADDSEVDNALKEIAGPIRHELSQLRLMGEIPRVYFVRDRHYSKASEVDSLLRNADFGEEFEPTDPTLFMKSKFELQMKLSDNIKNQIYVLESHLGEDDYAEEEELPEMRHDVLGLDHQAIMKRIAVNIDKSKKAWENFETRGESIISTTTPSRDFTAAQIAVEKLAREAAIREDFVKFLERKQFAKNTPERKRYRNLNPNEAENVVEEYHDPIPDGDFIDEDSDVKK